MSRSRSRSSSVSPPPARSTSASRTLFSALITCAVSSSAPPATRSRGRPSRSARDTLRRMNGARMVFLGFGKYARADRIYALQPIKGDDRGGGQRTLVWVEGVADPIIASRTERTILHDMGQEAVAGSPLLDEALSLAERLAEDAASGRVDLADLGRRARKLLESSNKPAESSQLF